MSMDPAPAVAQEVVRGCTECGACVEKCLFLKENGTPKALAVASQTTQTRDETLRKAYFCSLCGLCASVCPEGLNPSALFQSFRIAAIERTLINLQPYSRLLNYERWGRSALFADEIIPPECDTVIFPGCTFSGTRPETLLALTRHLRGTIPNLGIVLDCCSKPSHSLGRMDAFADNFDLLRERLIRKGIRTVLTVCPNCQNIFSRYGYELRTSSVLTYLGQTPLPPAPKLHGHGVMHIPCPLRGNDTEIHALRRLAEQRGLHLEPLKHKGRRSPCCGEGGAVSHVRPDLARRWTEQCRLRANGKPLITACAGCVQYLHRETRTLHILDLCFFPQRTMGGHPSDQGLKTYLNRIFLRLKLRQLSAT